MPGGIPGVEEETYFMSYLYSPEQGTGVHSILCCLEGRIGMCFDVVREGSSLWFLSVEESRAELPHTRHGVGGRRICLEDLAPLLIRRGVRGVLIP